MSDATNTASSARRTLSQEQEVRLAVLARLAGAINQTGAAAAQAAADLIQLASWVLEGKEDEPEPQPKEPEPEEDEDTVPDEDDDEEEEEEPGLSDGEQ